ncbi:unnamed protein product [Candida verbasci]|uniref:Altered inheritance of mitochondria protein 24, mitochondrial n=1 Tax=Candida verbasci TaxID=1227364 RepID=A0A9W4XAI0_9ASCO|nr:unnamed protein product [Candida verbasci]
MIKTSKIFKRCISIETSSQLSKPTTSSTTTDLTNINSNELKSYKTLEQPEFELLNNIIKVNQPPSMPIYIKRNSLISIFGFKSIKSKPSIWNFNFYQNLISTSPFSILVGCNKSQSIMNLTLDGKVDWAILPKKSLQIFTGNSLILNFYKLPKYISKNLSRRLFNQNLKYKTGFGFGSYLFLSGRGQVGLTGIGNIYNINLNEGEELLINKNNVLGITVNGPYDLQNCIVNYKFQGNDIKVKIIERPVLGIPTTQNKIIYSLKLTWFYSQVYFEKIRRLSKGFYGICYGFFMGETDFVKVIGPRNLLIQSSKDKGFKDTKSFNILDKKHEKETNEAL